MEGCKIYAESGQIVSISRYNPHGNLGYNMDILEKITLAKRNNWKICVYGLGRIGSTVEEECLRFLDLRADYYCDRNVAVLDRFDVADDRKITREELKNFQNDILVFVFVSENKYSDIYSVFEDNSYLHIITWNEILKSEYLISRYLKLDRLPKEMEKKKRVEISEHKIDINKRVAVFTCITGGYDKLTKPLCIEKKCDYFLITDVPEDVKIENDEYYARIPVSKFVPDYVKTPKAMNRYCKSHAFEIFKDYDYSVYADGNLQIIGRMEELVNRIGKYGVAFHRFPYGEDVYGSAVSLALRRRIRREDTCYEMQKLAREGFPYNYGFAECGIVVCEHNNIIGNKILCEWNDYYNNALAKRDQLYIAYVLWKNGITVDEVCTLPGNLRDNGYFRMVSEHSGFHE